MIPVNNLDNVSYPGYFFVSTGSGVQETGELLTCLVFASTVSLTGAFCSLDFNAGQAGWRRVLYCIKPFDL